MKLSTSIELVMQLAGQEVVAAGFKEITPEHVLMALLKLSELPVQEAGKIAPGAEVVEQLAKEVEAVRRELARRLIDATAARRALRGVLGKGASPFKGGSMHRSAECREVFDRAAGLAHATGNGALTASHLLEAILTAPTPAIKEVLGDVNEPKPMACAEIPLLDECGQDLVRMAADGRLDGVAGRDAECKVLLEALAQRKRPGALLVSDNKEAVQAAIAALAHALGGQDCPRNLKSKRLIDITSVGVPDNTAEEGWDHLERLLAEAETAEDVILLVPAIENDNRDGHVWPERLKSALLRGAAFCICRVAPKVHRTVIAKDREWRRVASVIWIRDEIEREVPRQL